MGQNLDQTLKRLQSLRAEVDGILAYGLREHISFDKMLDQRSKRVFGHPAWKHLPRWAHSEIEGHFAGGLRLIENTQLHNTLLLDGERLCSQIPEHDAKMKDRWVDINAQNDSPGGKPQNGVGERGMACFLVDGEWLPWRKQDRKDERVRLAALGN